MNKKNIFPIFIAITAVAIASCKKDKNTPGNNARLIKYEITGNFSGKVTVIYNDNVNGNTVLTNISLPWSKEITYPSNVTGIGLGASSSVPGISGQTTVMRIYSGGVVVKNSAATANTSGVLSIPPLSHVF